jgi:hypothetical protein
MTNIELINKIEERLGDVSAPLASHRQISSVLGQFRRQQQMRQVKTEPEPAEAEEPAGPESAEVPNDLQRAFEPDSQGSS